MRVPRSWVRDFTPLDAPTDEVVAALNQLGLEVDAVDEPGRDLRGVRVARVVDVISHPNADRLLLVDIEFGDGTTRVVCGARNIAPGMVVPFAPVGATLPGGVTLERRTFKGETSDGMLCSAAELGIGEDREGIVALDPASEIGADLHDALGLDDVVFELAITPNRPDAMCVVGVARELAAHFELPFEVPEPNAPTDATLAGDVTVLIEAPERCPRYIARLATVAIAPSPPWMAQRLVKAGVRPINNVVDVTNYVLLERNQPLHAFDRECLAGPGIVVRLASDGEVLTTLDGAERVLTDDELLICDAERTPQALAGIMGGSTSEISEATTGILLEAAYFEPMGIARSSKRLKLRSESSARFERGIDPDAVGAHAERALELLAEVASASVAPTIADEYPRPHSRPRIAVRTGRVNALLGTELTVTEISNTLEPLGIETGSDGDAQVATPPSWRPDLTREIDLVEEVARRIGFDRIGRTLPDTGHIGALTEWQRQRRLVADALVGAGLCEAITVPLVAPGDLERAGAPLDRLVAAANPLRAEESVLRTRILPGLVRVAAANQAHGLADVALFEMGRVFLAPPHGAGVLPEEPEHLAVVLTGTVRRRPVEPDRPVDLYDVADLVRVVADALGLADVKTVPADVPALASGQAAEVAVDGAAAGTIGVVGQAVVESFGLDGPVAVAELELTALVGATRRDRRFRAPSRFPASSIDLAFVVDPNVTAGEVLEVLRDEAGELLEAAWCFDEFRGAELGDRRSLAFALRFRSRDRTLTDHDVGALRARLVDAVGERLDATLRG